MGQAGKEEDEEKSVFCGRRNPQVFTRMFMALKTFDISQLYRRQPIRVSDHSLARVLTVIDLIAYGISSTVGAGIFVATGTAVETSGPSIILSYFLAALASMFSGLCYGEFAARIPVPGSAYTFSYVSLGELVAWIIGWCLTMEYAISASATARSWSSAVILAINSFGTKTPSWINEYEFWKFSLSPVSVIIIILCTIVLLTGARESSALNTTITIFNIGIIVFIIVLGSIFIDPSNWKPFAPYGVSGTFVATGTVFFAYVGFDAVTSLSGEALNPQRDMPISLMGTLLVAALLYVGAALVLTGMVPMSGINRYTPLASAFEYVGASWATKVVAIGSATTLTATTLASLMGQPRIFFQMAVDGLLFKFMLKLSKSKIPWASTIFTAVLSSVLAVFLDLDVLTDMISIGTLLAFTVVCGGVIILRYTEDPSSTDKKYAKIQILESVGKIVSRNISLVCAFWCLLSFILSILYRNNVSIYYWIPVFVVVAVYFIGFCFLKAQSYPRTFSCPLVPATPLIGMFVNVFLVSQKSLSGVGYFGLWLIAGILVYVFYGYWNSSLRKKELGGEFENPTPEYNYDI